MQYFKPEGDFYVGDCMPFAHDGIFHLYYLLDQGHHQGRGGLGGHQWAHASTRDLIEWIHHPLALTLDEDWEGSLCTGSTYYNEGIYHAFYATRKADFSQHLSHAQSKDGIHFEKTRPNPFASAPKGFSEADFRDPFVFKDSNGVFNMLVTTRTIDFPLHNRGGCLLRLVSPDLKEWQPADTFLIPGGLNDGEGIPECPDYFFWNGWYYLIFGAGLRTRYRMSREPMGPWNRPPNDLLGNLFCSVMKTAPFGNDRRIGVGWIGYRQNNADIGWMQWGGNAVFRELIQNPDGTLGTKFVPEMVPSVKKWLSLSFKALTTGVRIDEHAVSIDAREGLAVAHAQEMPRDLYIECLVRLSRATASFGIGLRGSGNFESKYEVRIDCFNRSISLATETSSLDGAATGDFKIAVVMKDDIIDVCVNGRQCLVNRCPALQGKSVFLFCEDGSVIFDQLKVGAI